MFFSYSVESGVIYLFQHLGRLISHSPGIFFQDSAVGSLEEAGILQKLYCYQHNSHTYQMCRIETTKGTRAEEAPPAPSGRSEMCSRVRAGITGRRAPLKTGPHVPVRRGLYSDKVGVPFGSLTSAIPAPPAQSPPPCRPGSPKKTRLLDTGGLFSPSLPLPLISGMKPQDSGW